MDPNIKNSINELVDNNLREFAIYRAENCLQENSPYFAFRRNLYKREAQAHDMLLKLEQKRAERASALGETIRQKYNIDIRKEMRELNQQNSQEIQKGIGSLQLTHSTEQSVGTLILEHINLYHEWAVECVTDFLSQHDPKTQKIWIETMLKAVQARNAKSGTQ